jgi:hypothetical protein
MHGCCALTTFAAPAADASADATDHFLSRCVDQDPSKRPTSAQLATILAQLLQAWGVREAGGDGSVKVEVNVGEMRAAAGALSGPPAMLKNTATPSGQYIV